MFFFKFKFSNSLKCRETYTQYLKNSQITDRNNRDSSKNKLTNLMTASLSIMYKKLYKMEIKDNKLFSLNLNSITYQNADKYTHKCFFFFSQL